MNRQEAAEKQGNFLAGYDEGYKAGCSHVDEETRQLGDALRAASDCINYLGDILNNMDVVTQEDQEYTEPLINKIRSCLSTFTEREKQNRTLNEDMFCSCQSHDKHGSTSAMHCNHCGKVEQSESWLRRSHE